MQIKGKSLLVFNPNFTVIDMETTGRSNRYEDITEMSAIRYRNYQPVASFSTLIHSKNSILPFVVALTGITDEMIATAPSIEEQILPIIEFIGDDVILGHNVQFDYGLINGAYRALFGREMNNDFVDTLRLSRLMNKDSANHKLETLCEYFDVRRDIGHRALEDCRQTADVYIAMKKKYVALRVKNNEQHKNNAFYTKVQEAAKNECI